jgi:hypothetical protein
MRCPECGARGYLRKTKTPEWRCGKCGHEWDSDLEIDTTYSRPADYLLDAGNEQINIGTISDVSYQDDKPLTVSVFRWIAVIPGAVLAAFAVMFPWHWILLFLAHVAGRYGDEGVGLGDIVRIIGVENVERAGIGFITPFVLITVAARIAPKFKFATAVVTTGVVFAVHVFVWGAWLSGNWVDIHVIWTLIASCLTIVGVWTAWTAARSWWETST